MANYMAVAVVKMDRLNLARFHIAAQDFLLCGSIPGIPSTNNREPLLMCKSKCDILVLTTCVFILFVNESGWTWWRAYPILYYRMGVNVLVPLCVRFTGA